MTEMMTRFYFKIWGTSYYSLPIIANKASKMILKTSGDPLSNSLDYR